jgi:hypothetical protein
MVLLGVSIGAFHEKIGDFGRLPRRHPTDLRNRFDHLT